MPAGTATAIAVIAALVVGFGAGWGLRKVPDPSDTLAAHTEALQALQTGQSELVEGLQRPVVIDAELRATLAEIPVQCRKGSGGDPMSVACQWATCLQFGQSAAQRPECSAVRDLLVDTLRGEACKDVR